MGLFASVDKHVSSEFGIVDEPPTTALDGTHVLSFPVHVLVLPKWCSIREGFVTVWKITRKTPIIKGLFFLGRLRHIGSGSDLLGRKVVGCRYECWCALEVLYWVYHWQDLPKNYTWYIPRKVWIAVRKHIFIKFRPSVANYENGVNNKSIEH